jgi:hypothetical protein
MARRLIGRGSEMQIAKAAIAAPGKPHALAGFGQIGEHGFFVLVEDLGPHGHAQHPVGARPPGALLAHAVLAVFGEHMRRIAEIDERVQPVHRLGPDIAPPAAIAAIGPAIFDIFLAPEAGAAIAAAPRPDVDLSEIEELHRLARTSLQTSR